MSHSAVTDNTVHTVLLDDRDIFLAEMDKIYRLERDVDKFNAELENASKRLQRKSKDQQGDHQAMLLCSATLAAHAQKDMKWEKALQSEDKAKAMAALDKELNSLQQTILTQVTSEDLDWSQAVSTATPGRLILDIKRSGMYKVRGVKQGFRENKELADGPDFNYYSNVVKIHAVRLALFRKRSRTRIIAMKDVSTAFLQSNKYPKGKVKYIAFKHPVTHKWIYFRQSGPIYGADYLTDGQILDYLGMLIGQDTDSIYLSMEAYIVNSCETLGVEAQNHRTPISEPIDTDSPTLPAEEVKSFLTGLGMLGWLATTARCDVSYTYSRIAQHCAKPNKSAMAAVKRAFSYLLHTKELSLSAKVFEHDRPVSSIFDRSTTTDEHRFMTDSDHAGNHEVQNKRRSQNGLVMTINGAPYFWQSKASSVAFACEAIGEAHADMSSGAVEIYAAGNATLDIMGIKYVAEEMGFEFPTPFVLEMDNNAARTFCHGSALKTKLKHIDCRQEWVKTLRDRNIMLPAYVPSEENLADLFTKILPPALFERLRDQLMKFFRIPTQSSI